MLPVRDSMKLSRRALTIKPSPIRKLIDTVESLENVLKLHVGEPDFDTPRSIKEAAKKAFDEGYTHYTFTAGIPKLREAIAEKLKQDNRIDADPENEITVTAGGYGALFSAIHAVIDEGDEVLIPEPAWPAYKGFVKLAGGNPIPLPLSPPEYRLNIKLVEERIGERTKMIIINTPNNPTGTVYGEEELRKLAYLALKKGIYILSDEVYEKIIFDDAKHFSIASIPEARNNTISVYSFSKTYAMTGWRIGYVVAPEEVTSAIRTIHSYMISCVSPAIQLAALKALTEPQDYVDYMVNEYRERRDIAFNLLNEIPDVECVKPKGTFYLFPDFSRIERNSLSLAEKLLNEVKVSTIPGAAFGEAGEGHLRISIAASRETIMEAINRIKKFISNSSSSKSPINKPGEL
jgi:aspartate/methionine/tyrosine aminotransferase